MPIESNRPLIANTSKPSLATLDIETLKKRELSSSFFGRRVVWVRPASHVEELINASKARCLKETGHENLNSISCELKESLREMELYWTSQPLGFCDKLKGIKTELSHELSHAIQCVRDKICQLPPEDKTKPNTHVKAEPKQDQHITFSSISVKVAKQRDLERRRDKMQAALNQRQKEFDKNRDQLATIMHEQTVQQKQLSDRKQEQEQEQLKLQNTKVLSTDHQGKSNSDSTQSKEQDYAVPKPQTRNKERNKEMTKKRLPYQCLRSSDDSSDSDDNSARGNKQFEPPRRRTISGRQQQKQLGTPASFNQNPRRATGRETPPSLPTSLPPATVEQQLIKELETKFNIKIDNLEKKLKDSEEKIKNLESAVKYFKTEVERF